jgi:hypothetical protein
MASAAPFGVGQVLVERNLIVLGDGAGMSPWPSTGVRFTDTGASAPRQSCVAVGTIVIRGHAIRCLPGVQSLAAQTEGAALLLVRDNFVENGLEEPFQNIRCEAVRYFDNRTTAGQLLPGQGRELQDQYEALNTQAEDTVALALCRR